MPIPRDSRAPLGTVPRYRRKPPPREQIRDIHLSCGCVRAFPVEGRPVRGALVLCATCRLPVTVV